MRYPTLGLCGLAVASALQTQPVLCEEAGANGLSVTGWPIASEVFTTAERQILPRALPAGTPPVNPAEVAKYGQYGYSAWEVGPGLPHEKRTELAPGYNGAPVTARLMSFFAITDIHIADKESPAQPIYAGWDAKYGPSSLGLLSQAYSPVILSTTQVLDAAVQTINALHEKAPFSFGISLGDNINNNQYNELRWFIDVLDGEVITPSSGAHAGASTIDYQKPYKAAGLNKSIPWYQVIGNHDQFWIGIAYENAKTQAAHIGNTVINIKLGLSDPDFVNKTGVYMGVVDGSTPYGDVVGAGPESDFPTPPAVIADANRHALATPESSSQNWMREFFTTASNPVGHGFRQSNLDNDFASYAFEPDPGMPVKIIALDDTCKDKTMLGRPQYYGAGCLDQTRLDWLTSELQKGQDEGKLMIIAAHIPVKPQANLNDKTPSSMFYDKDAEDKLLATLHTYPNLIMWIAGHRHLNTVTAQQYNPADASDHPERNFWEVETSSLRDFPQQLRTFDILRNADNSISIRTTNADTAIVAGSPAAKSRGYAIAVTRIFGATPESLADTTSHAYNAELVKQLTPEMQAKIAKLGAPVKLSLKLE
jgi:metallophosphoesterase (TIGR03768 family)